MLLKWLNRAAIVVPPAQQKELSCDVAPSSAKYENNSFSVPLLLLVKAGSAIMQLLSSSIDTFLKFNKKIKLFCDRVLAKRGSGLISRTLHTQQAHICIIK